MQKIRLVIIDDHTLIRQTWSFILNSDPRFIVVGEAATAEAGINLCKQQEPDIVILDINLSGMNGIEATPLLRKYVPAAKILGVSLHTQPIFAKKMIQNGASGYLTKNSPGKELFTALLELYEGNKYICNEIKNTLSAQILTDQKEPGINSLTIRELEIINMIKKGLSSKEIAEKIFLAAKTVEAHRHNILKKLKLKNTAALVNYTNTYSPN